LKIGITTSKNDQANTVDLAMDYIDAIRLAGGLPLLLPSYPAGEEPPSAREILSGLDALILSGGCDVDPGHFGEEPLPALGRVSPERDCAEIPLAKEALRRDLPILAICRGAQVLNVAAGGSLYQDLYSQVGGALQHLQKAPRWHGVHSISVIRESKLERILGSTRVTVNSIHHQAVKEVAGGFQIAARAPDGVIEAIEMPDATFILGVQWHPESMVRHDAGMLALFSELVRVAKARTTV